MWKQRRKHHVYSRHLLQMHDKLFGAEGKMVGELDGLHYRARDTWVSTETSGLNVEISNRWFCVWPQGFARHSKVKAEHKEKRSAIICSHFWSSGIPDPFHNQDKVPVPGNVRELAQLGWRIATWSDKKMATMVLRTPSTAPAVHLTVIHNWHAASGQPYLKTTCVLWCKWKGLQCREKQKMEKWPQA